MQLLDRHNRILGFLKQKKDFVKGSELAELLGVTDRTIRADINFIKSILGEEIITAVRTKGYKFNHNLQKISKTNYCDIDMGIPNNRMIYLLKRLILTEIPLNIFDLAEELLVSERSVETDIQRLKKILITRNLDFVEIKRDKDELYLIGIEKISDNLLYDVVKYLDSNFTFTNFQLFFTEINLDYLKTIIINLFNEFEYDSKYLSINCFLFDILFIMENEYFYKEPYGLKFRDAIESYEHEIEEKYFNLAITISENIVNFFGISFHEENINYIAYILCIKENMSKIEQKIRKEQNRHDEMYVFFLEMLEKLKEEHGVNLLDNKDLSDNFIFHIKIAIERIKRKIKLYNPLSEKMIKEYSYAIDLAILISDMIYIKFGIKFDFNEISYIAIYLASVVNCDYERLNHDNKLKILLYIPQGISVLNMLSMQISDLINQDNIIIDGTTNLKLNDDEQSVFSDYNLVITTSKKLATHNEKLFFVHQAFNEIEKDMLKKTITNELNNMYSHNFRRISLMYFHKELMFFDIELTSKREIITFLSNELQEKNYVNDKFVNLVNEREDIVSTEIETGVAFPHSLKNIALKKGVAIAFLKQPILWNNQKVKYIFMLANSNNKSQETKHFTLSFMNAISNQDFVDKLKNIKDYHSFLEHYQNFHDFKNG